MKKWMVAFGIDLYLIQIFFVLTFTFMPMPITTDYQWPIISYFLLAFFVLSLVLAVINIVCAIKMQKCMSASSINIKSLMSFKLALIPFFIVNFSFWSIFVLGTYNPFMIFLWVLIPFGIAYTYMVLLATSSYTISYIVHLGRTGILTKKQCVVHAVLQLIFVTDVFDFWRISHKIEHKN